MLKRPVSSSAEAMIQLKLAGGTLDDNRRHLAI